MDRRDRHLVVGASVFVHDSDGSVVSETLTDSSGTAKVGLLDGQLVSAVLIKGYTVDSKVHQARWFSTALGVPSGGIAELFVLDPPSNTVTPTPPAPMTVTVTLTTALANTDPYREIKISCGASANIYAPSSESYTLNNFTGCPGKSTFDVYGLVSKGGDWYGFATRYDVPFTPGGNISIKLEANDPNLSAFKLHASPIPSGSGRLDFQIGAYRTQDATGPDDDTSAIPPGVDETLTLRLPATPFAKYIVTGDLQVSTNPFAVVSRFSRVGASASAEREWAPVDDIAMFQPHVNADLGDISRPAISWDLEPRGKLGDAFENTVTWGASGTDQTYWYVWEPAARSGSVQLPVFPEKFSALRPKPGDTFQYVLGHQDLIEATDYAEYMAHHIDFGADNANSASLSQ